MADIYKNTTFYDDDLVKKSHNKSAQSEIKAREFNDIGDNVNVDIYKIKKRKHISKSRHKDFHGHLSTTKHQNSGKQKYYKERSKYKIKKEFRTMRSGKKIRRLATELQELRTINHK